MNVIPKMCVEMTHLKLFTLLPGANELSNLGAHGWLERFKTVSVKYGSQVLLQLGSVWHDISHSTVLTEAEYKSEC